MYQIILASGSPRRREILEQIGMKFTIAVSGLEEKSNAGEPWELVQELAYQKARDIANHAEPESVIIGADTVVAHKGKILGKPKDRAHAVSMITELSGDTHQVYTGVAIIIKNKGEKERTIQFYEQTDVKITQMSEAEIEDYVNSTEPMDKAGGYGIQGRFAVYVEKIDGDYYNVVGLPVHKVYQVLKEEGMWG